MQSRQLNFELLRILAMFLVLTVHANFLVFRLPPADFYRTFDAENFLRIYAEAISLVCVNVFILISGYFSIKLKWSGLVKFIYQVLFLRLSVFTLFCAIGLCNFSMKELFVRFLPTKAGWFVGAYLLLMLLAPLLNAFVEKCSRKELYTYTAVYLLVQSVIDWVARDSEIFNNGYSALSFAGLYLIGRCLALYPPDFIVRLSKKHYMSSFLVLALLNSCFLYATAHYIPHHIKTWTGLFMDYSSPLLILQSVCLFLTFRSLSVNNDGCKSRIVLWFSSSAFAVYLLHTDPLVYKYFSSAILSLYQNFSLPVFLLSLSGFLCLVFLASVLWDKVRLFTWEYVYRTSQKKH